jgi:hypothetical protein
VLWELAAASRGAGKPTAVMLALAGFTFGVRLAAAQTSCTQVSSAADVLAAIATAGADASIIHVCLHPNGRSTCVPFFTLYPTAT